MYLPEGPDFNILFYLKKTMEAEKFGEKILSVFWSWSRKQVCGGCYALWDEGVFRIKFLIIIMKSAKGMQTLPLKREFL